MQFIDFVPDHYYIGTWLPQSIFLYRLYKPDLYPSISIALLTDKQKSLDINVIAMQQQAEGG